jgi:hypothetical protein
VAASCRGHGSFRGLLVWSAATWHRRGWHRYVPSAVASLLGQPKRSQAHHLRCLGRARYSTRAAASADSAFTPDCTREARRSRLSPAIPPDWPIAAANRCAVANCQRQWRRRRNRRDAIWFRLLWFLRFSVGPSFLCRHRRLLLPRINSGTPDECPWPDPAFSGASWGLSPAQSGTVKRMFNWSVDGPYHQFCNPLCKKIRNKSGMRFALMF